MFTNEFKTNFAEGFINGLVKAYTKNYTEIPGMNDAIITTKMAIEVIGGEEHPDFMNDIYDLLVDVDSFRGYAIASMFINACNVVPGVDLSDYLNKLCAAYEELLDLEQHPNKYAAMEALHEMLQSAQRAVRSELKRLAV